MISFFLSKLDRCSLLITFQFSFCFLGLLDLLFVGFVCLFVFGFLVDDVELFTFVLCVHPLVECVNKAMLDMYTVKKKKIK